MSVVVGGKSGTTFDCYGDLHAIDNTLSPSWFRRFLIAVLNAMPALLRGF
jgi:hypothetical protein